MPADERTTGAFRPRAAAAPAKDQVGDRPAAGRLGEAQRAKAAKQAILDDLDDETRRREVARALQALLRQGRGES